MPRQLLAMMERQGLKYTFELLDAEDSDIIRGFYESLDTTSIYYRFLGIVKDFEGHVRRLFSSQCNYAVGAFFEGRLVAEGEGFSDCRDAELAFAVIPEHRMRGLATVIASLLILEALRRGMRTMEAYMHADNEAALRIGNKLGLNMCPEEGGVYHGRADVRAIAGLALRAIVERGARLVIDYGLSPGAPQ